MILEERPDAAPQEEEADAQGEDAEQRRTVGGDGARHVGAERTDGAGQVEAGDDRPSGLGRRGTTNGHRSQWGEAASVDSEHVTRRLSHELERPL